MRLVFLLLTLIVTWTSASGFAEDAYTIYRVIDGDTVVLQKNGVDYKIRLIGVDTPETVHPLKPVEWYGKEASQFLRNLLRGESVYLAYETKTAELDRYGRVLAYLYRAPDSLFVNLEIVRQGYGHAYTQYPFKHMELFRSYERKAQEARKGLWSQWSTPGSKHRPTGGNASIQQKQDGSLTVYVTKSGKKYHLGSCRYLFKTKRAISLQDAEKRYSACSVCKPPAKF